MTQQPYPHLVVLTSEDSEERAKDAFLDKFWKDYETGRDYIDDQVSGFWKRPPRDRLAWYEQHEPVFLLPDLVLELWLSVMPVEMAPVYWQANPQAEQMYQQAVQAAAMQGVDPMTIPPPPQPVYLGQAPTVLSPYWARNWAWNPKSGNAMLSDYADLQKQRAKREERRAEQAQELPEIPETEVAY